MLGKGGLTLVDNSDKQANVIRIFLKPVDAKYQLRHSQR